MSERAIIVTTEAATGSAIALAVESARAYAEESRSPRTRAAYLRQWKAFVAWARARSVEPLPALPVTVAAYLAAGADRGLKPATLAQALGAIGEAHRLGGFESPRSAPAVRETMKGIRRKVGVAPRRVRPVSVDDLRAMIAALPKNLRGTRDRALLCVGFAAALRRSELITLDMADVEFCEDGAIVTVRRSKVDQEAEGAKIGIPFGSRLGTCPVRSLRAWLDAAALTEGALLRSVDRHGKIGGRLHGHDVSRIVKAAASAAGIDAREYSAHSLRAGLATAAARAGRSDRSIMKQGRWRGRAMVDRYVRDASLFEDNAATAIGL